MMNKQVKLGALLSYVLIIINTAYGLFLTPYIISTIGDVEYGVYKTISSLSSSIMVLDLGIGGTVQRFVAKYRSDKEEEKISNFVAMNIIQATILAGVISVVCFCIYWALSPIYGNTFSAIQLDTARKVFIILSVNMIFHVFENVINGVITGYNDFIFGNGVKTARIILRILFLLFLLPYFRNAFIIVSIDLVLTVLLLLIEIAYLRFKFKLKIRLSRWENVLFRQSIKYTMLMFLTSIAAQINNSLDNVFIGALSGPALVTVYSIGLMFFTMFENLSTSISGVMLPTVTNALASDSPEENVVSIVVKAGRFQFGLLGAAVVGFAILGKDFISLWMGDGYEDAYLIGLILMLPSLFELCVNVCLSMLRAKNMLEFRTFTLFGTTILNAVITYFTVKYWSYLGAAVGTACSFIIGSLIIMNIYYYKKLSLPMFKIYREIFDGIWGCLLLSGIGVFISSRFLFGSWFDFAINVLIFGCIYVFTLLLFGLKQEEKRNLHIVKFLTKRNI